MSEACTYTADEMMTVMASRLLIDGQVCFVGIGLPSAAANLAVRLHAPALHLIYESGTIDTRPRVLPLSIGDGDLAETATAIVSLPEVFAYWLQAGRVDVGFLGAAQVDRFGNLNSTVIGPYDRPTTRLPGGGGAPDIALHAKQVLVVLKQSPRSFVARLDFRSSPGFLGGSGERARLRVGGLGPEALVSDHGVFKPSVDTQELELVARYPGVEVESIVNATGWPLRVAAHVEVVSAPTVEELQVLRDLQQLTREAHSRPIRLPI